MTEFSANLGFLWKELDLPDAIQAAKKAGFQAVECHWPFDTPAADISKALEATGLPMLALNTPRGNVSAGENGLSALAGRETEARQAIDQAIDYAARIGCPAVHVMAGFAEGHQAHNCFVENLRYAVTKAADLGLTILIEPLNCYDVPGYFLKTTTQAVQIIDEVEASNLKLMFDCYHVHLMEGDLTKRIERLLPRIGHIQFAGVPGRGEPDTGEVSYQTVFRHLRKLGYTAPLGAEYRPSGMTSETLGWLSVLGNS